MDRTKTARKVKIAEINTDLIRDVVRDYANTEAMKRAYSETFEPAGLFLRVTSLGQVSGLKSYNVDMNLYKRHKEEVLAICKNRISDIFTNGKASVKILNAYLNQLRQHSVKLKREMQQLKDEVLRHNATQADVAQNWKNGYAVTKFAADSVITVVSMATSKTPLAPVTMSISYMYGRSAELATVLAAPEEADIWSFKGSLTSPKLMAWDHAAASAFTGKMAFLSNTSAIVGTIFSVHELRQNLK